ncbi:SprT family zinc-dependent metalloprotease [Riemerella anatipestifer]|nr:SprT family zinc-dependent metalloprotease [Riemerella anatipestifer]MDY3325840.1 SprT family zinc-dependent metalloprotease [Riemerella anatipestifer]MDY3354382.1 SprT family zinc-dependent metalloprotease [Riemerella anatipestifer]
MQLPDNYILIRKEVKHARLRVSEDGRVRIIAPPSFSDEDISSMLKKKAKWIDSNLKYFNEMSKIELQRNQLLLLGNRYSYFYDTTYAQKVIIDHEHKTIRAKRDLLDANIQENWYRTIAKKHLTKRTKELSAKLKLPYNKFFIRESKTKWGNCSKDKNISLNWKLIKAPDYVIDYLIVHELLHTVVMSHTHKFWTLLKSYYPDYKESIKWLEKYGNSL